MCARGAERELTRDWAREFLARHTNLKLSSPIVIQPETVERTEERLRQHEVQLAEAKALMALQRQTLAQAREMAQRHAKLLVDARELLALQEQASFEVHRQLRLEGQALKARAQELRAESTETTTTPVQAVRPVPDSPFPAAPNGHVHPHSRPKAFARYRHRYRTARPRQLGQRPEKVPSRLRKRLRKRQAQARQSVLPETVTGQPVGPQPHHPMNRNLNLCSVLCTCHDLTRSTYLYSNTIDTGRLCLQTPRTE